MLKVFNDLFTKNIPLDPEMWLYILLGIVVLAFAVTLIVGLVGGEFKKINSLMKSAVGNPKAAVGLMKQMPVSVKKQYKHARMTNVEPSVYVTQEICVSSPYKHSLISKVWLVTLVATLICVAMSGGIAGLSALTVNIENLNEEKLLLLSHSAWVLTVTVALVGGLLTFVGAIIGKVVYGGAVKTYESFAAAIDGGDKVEPMAAAPAPEMPVQEAPEMQPDEQPVQEEAGYAEEAEQPVYEPQPEMQPEEQPVYEAAEPVMQAEPMVDEEEIRRQAREEALARARAEQEAAQAQAARAAAAAQAQAAAAQAAQAQAAQAAAAAQAQAQAAKAAQAQAAAQPAGSSSADDIIARIDQIEREGASREAMREVATQLQKERAKPENKTPEQQKKLNEALSKLLKAMSSAGRK